VDVGRTPLQYRGALMQQLQQIYPLDNLPPEGEEEFGL
jgi:hypothetical protein